jgi:PAS domain S-box-containing protein
MDLKFNELPVWSIFDSAPVPIAIVDHSGKFIDVNDKWAEYLGYSKEELKTMNYTQITHPEDIIGEDKEIDLIIRESNRQAKQYIKRYISKDGRVLQFKLAFSTINSENGSVIGFVSWILPIEFEIQKLVKKTDLLLWVLGGIVMDVILAILILFL